METGVGAGARTGFPSLMPKGVEHVLMIVLGPQLGARVSSSDAERR